MPLILNLDRIINLVLVSMMSIFIIYHSGNSKTETKMQKNTKLFYSCIMRMYSNGEIQPNKIREKINNNTYPYLICILL